MAALWQKTAYRHNLITFDANIILNESFYRNTDNYIFADFRCGVVLSSAYEWSFVSTLHHFFPYHPFKNMNTNKVEYGVINFHLFSFKNVVVVSNSLRQNL